MIFFHYLYLSDFNALLGNALLKFVEEINPYSLAEAFFIKIKVLSQNLNEIYPLFIKMNQKSFSFERIRKVVNATLISFRRVFSLWDDG